MTYGYSQSLVTANQKAVVKSPGVALGRVCISIGISVSQVSAVFGVSRMCVYNWFKGDATPTAAYSVQIEKYMHSLKRQHKLS